MTATPVVLDDCQIAPATLVPALPCEPQTIGRLYSTAPPLPMPTHGAAGGVAWEPHDCGYLTHSYCPSCTTPGDPKVFDGLPDLRGARPFAVYGSFECSGPGYTDAEMQARARTRLEEGEEWRVESEFHATLHTPTTESLDVGQGVSLVSAITRLGNWAADMRCVPTIHVPRGLLNTLGAAQLIGSIDGNVVRLHDGTRVVAGAGYPNVAPDGTPGGDAEFWLYVTGPVRIWRGDIFEPSQESAAQVNLSNNDRSSLAERVVLVGHDCGAAYLRTVIT